MGEKYWNTKLFIGINDNTGLRTVKCTDVKFPEYNSTWLYKRISLFLKKKKIHTKVLRIKGHDVYDLVSKGSEHIMWLWICLCVYGRGERKKTM